MQEHHGEIRDLVDKARLDAQASVEHWGRMAVQNIDFSIIAAGQERDQVVDEAQVALRNISADGFRNREGEIRNFVGIAEQRMSSAKVTSAEQEEIKTWMHGLVITTVRPIRESHDQLIADRELSASILIERQEEGNKTLIEERRNQQATRLNLNVLPTLGIDQLQTRITDMTIGITSLLDLKDVNQSTLVKSKVAAHSALVASKHAQFSATLVSALSKLDQKIKNAEVRSARASHSSKQHNQDDDSIIRPRGYQAKTPPKRPDPRVQTLMGRSTGLDKQPFVTVLGNIDHHRKKGKTDEAIYMLLVKNFHPDTSERLNADEIMKAIGMSYDKQRKQFIV